jgi:NADPH:quinone reductase-like Zn-dependent oxidoreductase
VASRSGWDCRRRRRGPKVRQERGQAVASSRERILRRGRSTLLGQQMGQQEAANARDVRVGYTYVHPDGPTLARIAELMHAHKLRINIDSIFPLEDVASAHAAGDKGHVRGLLVLDISS